MNGTVSWYDKYTNYGLVRSKAGDYILIKTQLKNAVWLEPGDQVQFSPGLSGQGIPLAVGVELMYNCESTPCDRADCQTCCEHDERDHGICLDCGHEVDPGEAIDRAMDALED